MALSTCIKCGATVFELKEAEPRGGKYKLMFVQCSQCGGVVGATEYYNIGQLIHTLAKKLKIKL